MPLILQKKLTVGSSDFKIEDEEMMALELDRCMQVWKNSFDLQLPAN
jgi:hypothetical protein